MIVAIAVCVTATVAFVLGWMFRGFFLPQRIITAGALGVYRDVGEFHKLCGVPENALPSFPSQEVRDARWDFLHEEMCELEQAEAADDMIEIADALADIVYIAVGTARVYGIPFHYVWHEVQESNMRKRWDDGTAHIREDGKVIKPPTWSGPNIRGALFPYDRESDVP